jgi:hypothetical protein
MYDLYSEMGLCGGDSIIFFVGGYYALMEKVTGQVLTMRTYHDSWVLDSPSPCGRGLGGGG